MVYNSAGKEMIEELRARIAGEEFDYQALLDGLREYARPRDKITDLLRREAIIRVKKGIYVFGGRYSRRPFSREVLANMIFGPSYLSLDYALYYHGLIPERVEALTSVTCSRSRRFLTPVGLFIYRRIPMKAYQIGIDQVAIKVHLPVYEEIAVLLLETLGCSALLLGLNRAAAAALHHHDERAVPGAIQAVDRRDVPHRV